MATNINMAKATNLFEFFKQKGETLPSVGDRSVTFEKFGLGKASDFVGSTKQNILLLEKLQAQDTSSQAPVAPATPTQPVGPVAPLAPTVEAPAQPTATPVAPTQPELTKTTEVQTPQFGPSTFTGFSIVDYLKSVNQSSDFASRAKLAEQVGIENYTGTGPQNTELLRLLRGGQPKTTPTVTGPTEPVAPLGDEVVGEEQIREDAAAAANKTAQDTFDAIKDKDVDIRESAIILADVKEKLEEKPPEAPDLRTLFEEEKVKLGLDALETELAEIDSKIDAIKNRALSAGVQFEEKAVAGEGDVVITTSQVRAKQLEINRQAQIDINLLSIERGALARIVQNKFNTLELIMDFSQLDFENASKVYKDDFDRTLELYNIINDKEESEKDATERATDDARSNWIIIHNLLKDNNLDYESLTPAQKLTINQLEIQGGLLAGITAQIISDEPDKKIQTVSSRTDPDGTVFFDVLLVDGNGALSIRTISRGQAKVTDQLTTFTNEETGKEMTPIEAARSIVIASPDASEEALINAIRESVVDDKGKSLITASDATRIVKEIKQEAPAPTPEEQKTSAVEGIQGLKDRGIEKDKALRMTIEAVAQRLGFTPTQARDVKLEDLPSDISKTIEEAFNEVYPEQPGLFSRFDTKIREGIIKDVEGVKRFFGF